MAIGMSEVAVLRFVFFNMLGGLICAPFMAGGGYLFGNALQLVLEDTRGYEEAVLWGLVLLGAALWVIH